MLPSHVSDQAMAPAAQSCLLMLQEDGNVHAPPRSTLHRLLLVAGVLACGAWCGTAAAQEWARKMFATTEHDFGAVARGSKCEYRFQFKNLYVEDVHVASVTSSCGCTTPYVTKETLKTFETAEIVAEYNTRSFLGQRSAVLTVTFDKPFPATVQLRVTGYIRSDIVLTPEGVNFGSVAQGSSAEKSVDIDYAGRNDWQIVDVRTTSDHLEAELIETRREAGRVAYRLVVRLRPEAPAGYFRDQLLVVTNDRRLTQFPVDVEAKVEAPVSVSPAQLFLGVLQPGQQATKHLVVRAGRPFRVLEVICEQPQFQFRVDATAKPLHLIPVMFAADAAGKYTAQIQIRTDLGDGAIASVSAYAQVVDAPREPAP
jgi:hypothetical protein